MATMAGKIMATSRATVPGSRSRNQREFAATLTVGSTVGTNLICYGTSDTLPGRRGKAQRPRPAGRTQPGRAMDHMSEPARPWIVRAASGFSTSHRSRAPALEQVKAGHASGSPAYVYRWDDGGWVLCEYLKPPPSGRSRQQEQPWPFWCAS